MKHILSVITLGVALLASAFSAKAQTYAVQTIPQASLTSVPADGTSNVLITLDVRKQESVALAVKFNNSSATNALNWTLVIRKSVDGSNWSSNDKITWAFANPTSSNTTYAITNFSSLGGYGYLQLYTIATAGVGTLQLEEIKYGVKNPNR